MSPHLLWLSNSLGSYICYSILLLSVLKLLLFVFICLFFLTGKEDIFVQSIVLVSLYRSLSLKSSQRVSENSSLFSQEMGFSTDYSKHSYKGRIVITLHIFTFRTSPLLKPQGKCFPFFFAEMDKEKFSSKSKKQSWLVLYLEHQNK